MSDDLSDLDPDLTGTTLDERYELIKRIGEGGMGQVYAGRHITLGSKIAVKVLHQRLAFDRRHRERFLREARAASAIKHPNIVEIIDFGHTPHGSVYFVMEYIKGRDLKELIEEQGRLPWPRARNILQQAVRALSAAHRSNIIHRDIKSANCIVFDLEDDHHKDLVKLLDFGIAKIGSDCDGLTKTGAVFGTVAYMAPELSYGSIASVRSDIYAVGIMAYEMLTGVVPFTGVTAFEILTRHLNDAPIPPRRLSPDLPEAAEHMILRAIAKRPEDRFASMEELAGVLKVIPAINIVTNQESRPHEFDFGDEGDEETAIFARGDMADQAPEGVIGSGAVGTTSPRIVQPRPTEISAPVQGPVVATTSAPIPTGPLVAVGSETPAETDHGSGLHQSPASVLQSASVRAASNHCATTTKSQLLQGHSRVSLPETEELSTSDEDEISPVSRSRKVSLATVVILMMIGAGGTIIHLDYSQPSEPGRSIDDPVLQTQRPKSPVLSREGEAEAETETETEVESKKIVAKDKVNTPSPPASSKTGYKGKTKKTRRKKKKKNKDTNTSNEDQSTKERTTCWHMITAANKAKAAREWRKVLEYTERRRCWRYPGLKFKSTYVEALFQLERFKKCIQESKGSNDPEVIKMHKYCTHAMTR